MSNPSYSNIDRWLFELMEGNLSPEQVAQLEAFLIQHPELDVDRDMWELAKVDADKIVYPHQKKLERRRPVGLYMALGFTSIFILTGLGVFNEYSSSNILLAENNIPNSDQSEEGNTVVSNINSRFNNYTKANPVSGNVISHSSVNGKVTFNPNNSNTISNQKVSFNGNKFQADNIKNQINVSDNSEPVSYPSVDLALADKIQNQNVFAYQDDLETQKAKPIEYEREAKFTTTFKSTYATPYKQFGGVNYKESFNSKLNKFGRNVQRMMDNPIALKNMKDPYYHVPGMQAMDISFASVGTLLATRVQTVSRAQWLGADNQQFMNQISVDGYSYGMRGGIGFQFNQNYYGQGVIQNYNASLTYSPKFSVSRDFVLEPSFRYKMGTKTIDSDQIQVGSQVEYDRMNTQDFYSNGAAPIGRTLWYKDVGAGLMINTKWFFVGLQGDNLLRHYDNIYSNDLGSARRAGKHLIGTIGTDYESKKVNNDGKSISSISPYIVYQKQEKLSEAWVGVNFRYQWLTIGGAISSKFEPAASFGVKFKYFMLSYNADYVHSGLLQTSQLSHQLTIRFLSKPSRIGQRLLNQ